MSGARALPVLTTMLTVSIGCATTSEHEPLRPPPPPRASGRSGSSVWSVSTSEQIDSLGPDQSWQILATDNFRLFHLDRELARRVGSAAERQRAAAIRTWLAEVPSAWRPLCQIALYPSRKDLVSMTGGGQKTGSASSRAARPTPGGMLSQRIHLAADDPEMLSATLPHEVTHVVIGRAFGNLAVPLWANEGMALLAESRQRNRRWVALLKRHLAAGRFIAVENLLGLREYPEQLHLYYAQSMSLTLYLVSRADPKTFVSFLKRAVSRGYAAALKSTYGMASVEALQRSWLRFATD